MRRLILILLCAFSFSFSFCANSAEAAKPRLFRRVLEHRRSIAPTYQQRYDYLNWRYPKYTGAFHASYFRDLGVPSGDVGLRGNGLYASPW